MTGCKIWNGAVAGLAFVYSHAPTRREADELSRRFLRQSNGSAKSGNPRLQQIVELTDKAIIELMYGSEGQWRKLRDAAIDQSGSVMDFRGVESLVEVLKRSAG